MSHSANNDLSKKFSKGIIAIHWLTAILILVLFPLGKYMTGIEPSEKVGLIKIHVILGIIVFVLSIIRSVLFFKSPRPEDLKTGSKLVDKLAVWIHNIFYFLFFGIAISGIATLIIGGYVEVLKTGITDALLAPEDIPSLKPHGVLSLIMMVLLVLHVVGVLKHYILTKENTLKRIF